MPNMRLTKLPAREQAPDIRNCNFEEVSLGYDEAMAVEDGDVTLVPKGCYWRVNSYAEALVFDAYERARDGSALPGPGAVARALTAAALLALATDTTPTDGAPK